MKYLNLLFAAMLVMSSAFASPGAHGPNGEHLDGQATATGAAASVPRIETFTEAFELLGHLSGGELSIMIDRYETNEPVLGGVLEVQYKDLKAKAKFHADLGDYAIDDPKFLAAISKPGTHALLFTLVVGEESDLLEGTLTVAAAADDHGHGHGVSPWLLAAIGAAILAAAAVFVARRRQRKKV
jgi:LPXTG-motif cell wall-anchored protein